MDVISQATQEVSMDRQSQATQEMSMDRQSQDAILIHSSKEFGMKMFRNNIELLQDSHALQGHPEML